MANKAIFSYGNGGKRKIGHSKFDMGHEHIMSANFGGLLPAAVFETLPDDYWDISDNTVTLLKPLTAPAFTRINQNFYGAYVRNQQIWKYWNDYISNGTAFGDVYGNNVTNQSLQNAWDVPSIPTPYLQSILKIGFGNAAPVFRYSCVCEINGDNDGIGLASFITKNASLSNAQTGVVYRITDLFSLLLQVDKMNSSVANAFVLYAAEIISLKDYAFDVWFHTDGNLNYFLFEFYCSLRQYLSFASAFKLYVDPSTYTQSSTVGENVSDNYSISTINPSMAIFRFFADRTSSDPTTSQSAFVMEKSDYLDQNSRTVKSLDYYPRIVDPNVREIYKYNDNLYVGYVYQSISSPYWGFRYLAFSQTPNTFIRNAEAASPSFNELTQFYWQVDADALFGVTHVSGFRALFESFANSIHYIGVGSFGYSGNLDMFLKNQTFTDPLLVLANANSRSYSFAYGFGNSLSNSGSGDSFFNFNVIAACDLGIYLDPTIQNFLPYRVSHSVSSRDSLALGYDAISMIVYLCNNSSILMDSLGIKVDPLSQRPFSDYRFELTNALPTFAYSKIWADNFRNPVVSSPELDYSESNGPIFADGAFYGNFVFATPSTYWFLEPAMRPARYVGKVVSDFSPNGWTLELTTYPRNSQGSKIHTHLPIRTFQDVFCILTGHNFDRLFASLTSVELNVYDYYMPSYYNGLLHLKFQNFNKDYFTSALLDPMSGANQVVVGNTINELRENEAKQHWWERTAMYRSIKNWFQGTYGITPIELPEDSRITGTDHVDVNIGEVIQTSGSTPESPQGTRSGLGGARGSGTLCHGHANEHGWIFILVSHTIESQYLQAYDKMWDVKESFLDYPTVDFAGIGNESILQKEVNYTTVPTILFDWNFQDLASVSSVLYLPCSSSSSVRYRGTTNPLRKYSQTRGRFNIAQNAGTSLDNVFGFIPRYSSYKFKFDQVSGQFRNELKFWHTFKRYLTSPILCHEFVNWEMAADDDEINRIFAVSDDFLDDKFAIDCFINASVDRALPFVCVPSSR